MRLPSLSRLAASFGLIALFLGLGQGVGADTIVYSNNPAPGDWVVSPNVAGTSTDVAVGSSGWSYSAYSGDGTSVASMGIRTDFPRSGNGSVVLSLNGNGAETDMTYWTGNSLGSFSSLNALSYDWYRDGSSNNNAIQAPAMGIWVSNNGGTSGKWVIYEPYYNEAGGWTAPTDQWVTSNAYNSGNGQFWSYALGPWTQQSLSAWQTALAGYDVYALAAFAGSGWGNTQFLGAIDNVTVGFDGHDPVTYNFEVVPEPSSIVLSIVAGGIGLIGVARRRSRRAV